ncbi:MAG TPA: tRNA (guanosine(37)-N1)-methyltransferase TrmD [Steroidobacter sp.]|jgi:tRNA (guanine37-N1)-methyltransferase|nr:tRNA (guanosine(37)-N1)-methyltransferase TrmD [Steroidobacter sp.]
MRIEVVTLFPEFIASAVRIGVLGRALESGQVVVNASTPREFAPDVHRTVDDRPYGGGPGMVLKIEPTRTAIRAAKARLPAGSRSIYLAADGEPLTQAKAQQLAQAPGMLLLAGRYEGVDERLIDSEIDESVTIGDYVLSGGELPALVLIDAVVRLLPGVLGHEESARQDSFAAGLLDWPHYTRPEVFEGRAAPAVLIGGNHAAIRRWREKQALGRTWLRRPDLMARLTLTAQQQQLLNEFMAEHRASERPPQA